MSALEDVDIVCYGEVLFDILPDGKKPGGAPMNVAINLQNLGVKSAVISRIGNDSMGRELLEFMKSRKVNTDLVQVGTRDTGTVKVRLDANNNASYTIVEDVSWDNIDDRFLIEDFTPKYILHGSLISRADVSKTSLDKLLTEKKEAKVVLDLNIRSPYYSKYLIDEMLHKANILKMNEEEFRLVKRWFHVSEKTERAQLKAMISIYPSLETVVVTKGGKGAIAFSHGQYASSSGVKVEVKDTIGSGDAFLAAFIAKLHQGRSLKDTLDFACATGAFVATKSGANPTYKEDNIHALLSKSI